jgi:hypothetical protein
VTAGSQRLQAREAGFHRAALIVRAAFMAVFIGQMNFDALQLRQETAEGVGDRRFDVASQVFTAVDVIVSRDVN